MNQKFIPEYSLKILALCNQRLRRLKLLKPYRAKFGLHISQEASKAETLEA